MEGRFEELIGHWAQAFWLIAKILHRCGIEIPPPNAQIPGIIRPLIGMAVDAVEEDPAIPEGAKAAAVATITKWLAVADVLDHYENDPVAWRDAVTLRLLIEVQISAKLTLAELDKRDQAN